MIDAAELLSQILLSSYYNLQTLATKPYAIPVNDAFQKIFSISIIIF